MERILKLFSAYFTLVLLSVSCTNDPSDDEGPPPPLDKDKVNIGLYTNAGNYKAPNLRAGTADENTVNATPWVAVFQGTDDSATFSEVVQAFIFGDKSYVTLAKNDNPCRLLLIANAPATFYNNSTQMAFNQENLIAFFQSNPVFGDAMKSFLTPQLSTPNQTTVPYASTTGPYPMLPMSGVYDVSKIDAHTIIGTTDSEFLLTRAVAKVTVTSTDPNFTLLSATVVNTPVNGQFYSNGTQLRDNTGNLTDYLTSPTGDGVSGIAPASGNSTIANPIYSYESRKEEQTSVIIKATYNSTTYYYRLAFNLSNSNPSPLNVLRNKYYSFNITSVKVPGYTTVADAKANRPSNINYNITVTDQVSYDIVDNGVYYVGVSNSNYILYNSAAVTTPVIAFTVSTDATNAMGISTNSITYTNSAGTAFALTTPILNLSPTAGTIATTDVKVTIPIYAAATTGTITIKLGNITKTISMSRLPSLTPVNSALPFPSNNVSGTVSSQGTGGDSWISVSSDGTSQGMSSVVLTSPGTIYVSVSPNVVNSGGVVRTNGEVYIARSDNSGRLKLSINQNFSNSSTPTVLTGFLAYVGTFHRWNQTGERLIRIPWVTGAEGTWSADVIQGADFIIMDTSPSQDAGVTYVAGTQNPKDMNVPANDAAYQVTGNSTRVTGTLTAAAGNFISFRVGLTSILASADAAPRYGVIALSFNNGTKFAYIRVRQGETADYLMRPSDPIGGSWVSSTRPLAAKFSPYNLTDPQRVSAKVDRGTKGYVFTDYPTKAGYFLQWGRTAAWYPTGAASSWVTSSTSGFWANNLTRETCPEGYRRPNDGSTTAYVVPSNNSPSTSEMRQSLWVNPNSGINQDVTYVTGGFYADGYFDRRQIVSSTSTSGTITNATVGSGADVAYVGVMFYNPYTNASVFFPNAGWRYQVNGDLKYSGEGGYYLTTALSTSGGGNYYLDKTSNVLNAITTYDGYFIRCVAN